MTVVATRRLKVVGPGRMNSEGMETYLVVPEGPPPPDGAVGISFDLPSWLLGHLPIGSVVELRVADGRGRG